MKNHIEKIVIAVALSFCILNGCTEGTPSPPEDLCDEKVDISEYAAASTHHLAKEVPKLIWTFWDKGENKMPPFHRFNVHNWRAKLEPQGYKITVANTVPGDPNNISKLLMDDKMLPEFFNEMDKKTASSPASVKPIYLSSAIVQSDFARIALLEKFGGVWMDSSDLLIEDMAKILQKFEDSPQTVAGFVEESYSGSSSLKVNGIRVDGLENWMLAAKKGSPLIQAWRKVFTEYWRTRKPDEPISEHPIYCGKFNFGGMGSSPNYHNQHAALKYVVYFQPKLGEQIFHLDLNPWWLGDRSSPKDKDGGILASAIGDNKFILARQAIDDGAKLLKFAGYRTSLVNAHFSSAEDFCRIDNFFAKVYELSMSKPWCITVP